MKKAALESPTSLPHSLHKAYSSDEVVRAEVVLWRLWVEIVEIERALRVGCFELGFVYPYTCHWLKHHSMASLIVVEISSSKSHCIQEDVG